MSLLGARRIGRGRWLFMPFVVAFAGWCNAAVFYVETFDTGANGWTVDRDPGKMNGSWNGTEGNPPGTLAGTFNSQVIPSPQFDAWEATSSSSGGAFTGNYWSMYPGFSGYQFDFYAANVLPSQLTVSFGDGTNVFSYTALVSYVPTTGMWYTVSVPLAYTPFWYGGTAEQFSNALTSVSFVDIEVTRKGTKAQTYYMDNFRILNDWILVPEPTSGLFWFGWALVFGGLRSKLNGRRQRSPYALPAATSEPVAA